MEPKKTTLSNGLTVLTVPPINPNVSGAIFLVRSGPRFESVKTNGLSRFSTLMSMKKTRKFPTQLDLAGALDKTGAFVNFEASREYTSHYIKSYTPYFSDSLELLAEMIINPIFDMTDFSQEKQFFASEIDARERDQNSIAIDKLNSLVFQDLPISYSGVGDRTAISGLNLSDLNQFRADFYTGHNSLLVVSSSDKNIEKKVEELFSALPAGQKVNVEPIVLAPNQEHVRTIELQSPNTSIAVGFPAYARNTKEKYTQLLLDVMLSKTKGNTRMGTIFREEALASVVSSSTYHFSDTGLFVIQLASTKDLCQKAYQRVLEELDKLASNPVSEVELDTVKRFYKGNMMLGFNDVVEQLFFYGLNEFIEDKSESIESFLKKLDAVSGEDVQNVANKLFDADNLYVCMVGATN